MRGRTILTLLALQALAAPTLAQHGQGSAPPSRSAPREASQFEFLVGQWEIVAEPHVDGLAARIHGNPKFPGTWKAWRGLDGWGIEDEIRLTDASGNPRALTHCVRVYDATAGHWNTSSLDVYRSSFQSGTAEWREGEMQSSGRGTDPEGRAYVSRTRFYDITPDSFRFQQDRSYDDGRTWTEGFLKLEAKRVAAVAPR
jgi:hypothetical protein